MNTIFRSLLSASMLLSSAAFAAVPHTFTAGTPARAADVNANFTDLDNRLTAVENQVAEIGAVSVSAHAFTNHFGDSSGCLMRGTLNYRFFANTSGTCRATASVALPHNATITHASCRVHDAETTPQIAGIYIARANLFGDTAEIIFQGAATGASSSGAQYVNMSDVSSAGDKVVDNTTYAYYFFIEFDTTSLVTTTNLRIYNCKAHYTLPSS